VLRHSLRRRCRSGCSLVALRRLCGCGRWMSSWQRRHSPPHRTGSAVSDKPRSRHRRPERLPVLVPARSGGFPRPHPSPRRTRRRQDGGEGHGGRAGGPGRVQLGRPHRWRRPGIGDVLERPTDIVVEHGSGLRVGAMTAASITRHRQRQQSPVPAARRRPPLWPAVASREVHGMFARRSPGGHGDHNQRGDTEGVRLPAGPSGELPP
jgi:hypothetical protein